MKKIIGIMGATNANEIDLVNSYALGKYCAEKQYVTLTRRLEKLHFYFFLYIITI